MKKNHNLITIKVDVMHETEKAWLVAPEDKPKERKWVPKSVGQLHTEGLEQELELPEEWAFREGLI